MAYFTFNPGRTSMVLQFSMWWFTLGDIIRLYMLWFTLTSCDVMTSEEPWLRLTAAWSFRARIRRRNLDADELNKAVASDQSGWGRVGGPREMKQMCVRQRAREKERRGRGGRGGRAVGFGRTVQRARSQNAIALCFTQDETRAAESILPPVPVPRPLLPLSLVCNGSGHNKPIHIIHENWFQLIGAEKKTFVIT